MKYYPVHLDISGKKALVVGGGGVAFRKVSALLECNAAVTVISPEISPEIEGAASQISIIRRCFNSGDTTGFFIVFAATDIPAVNSDIVSEADKNNILCCSVDSQQSGSFVTPAVHRAGSVTISAACDGVPVLSRRIRNLLSNLIGTEYAFTAEIMKQVRQKLLTQNNDKAYNKQIFERLAIELPEKCSSQHIEIIDELLKEVVGKGFSLSELGISPEGKL